MCPAAEDDVGFILSLRAEAARWLAEDKRITQWEKAWPTLEAQRRRILEAIREGRTWMLRAPSKPLATITLCDEDCYGFWRGSLRESPPEGDRAVYIHRLIVSRRHRGLGARIIDWAAERGRERGARWLRLDIWRDNPGLEAYYRSQGFTKAADIPEDVLDELGLTGYPSTVLMHR
ncbi:hypothetical protein Pta02_10600 [Planobispora takensis]|uniref:N-acetyltransferase domain-containing protein n=2 Tax=Planobispora takensis TaxID=1367882 RepID=A0A8J3SU54_9ACTN|nr:hypothetical protein Pta02_10600 [Planobispora takensis]